MTVALHEANIDTPPFLLFFAAVAIAAGYGGFVPGMLCTLLVGLAALQPWSPELHDLLFYRGQPIHTGIFLIEGGLISGLSEWLRLGLRRADEARRDAEEGRRRLGFLEQAGTALDASLDYETTLHNLARVAVPYLADWCVIDVLHEDGSIRTLAVAPPDSSMSDLICGLLCRYPLDPQGQHPVHKAIQSGRPVIHLDIPDSALVAAARDEDHLQAMRRLSIRSYLCAPLRGRDGMLGTLLLVSSHPSRYVGPERTLAEDLARRAALAVDNARLYQDANAEIDVRRVAEERLEHHQEEIIALNERLRRAMIETHHRVKNNLQIITAMIDMRLMEGAEQVSIDEIRRVAVYIKTLAAVHDILTQEAKDEAEADGVSARSILEKLLPLMEQTIGDRRIKYSVAEVRLPAKKGTSLALVVNELVSNAVKYGKGDILVDLSVSDSGKAANKGFASLTVCDDGIGFPPDFDPVQASNTGLDLICNLSQWDLGGEASFSNRSEGGARVEVRFPIPPA